jgi:outer membrane protein TolC
MSTGSTCARSTASFIREGSQIGRPSSALSIVALTLVACATYTPAPVRPDSELEPYNGRTLDDPGLLAWFDSLGQERPAAAWTPRQLALAAVWFRQDRAVRLAEIRSADAALVTAGSQPQAGVSTDLEYAFSDPQASSRWGVALTSLFTLELGGKRGARIGRAMAAALAARARAVEAEWQQVNQVYRTALEWDRARQLVVMAREERSSLDSVTALVQARFEGGTLTRLDLARFEGERRATIASEQAVGRRESAARAALAIDVGIPRASAEQMDLAPGGWPDCGSANGSRDTLQQTALGARWSIRRAVADYQVSEGDLRLAVADAAPDLTLGPGLFFDQGSGKFTLGVGLPSLKLNRNRGPIGEALARRAVAGSRLMQEQELVLGEVDAALSGCELAERETLAADSLAQQVERQVRLTEAAWSRGETGRLEVVASRLEAMRSRQASTEAHLRRREAGLALERASGAWGARADGPWPGMVVLEASRRTE